MICQGLDYHSFFHRNISGIGFSAGQSYREITGLLKSLGENIMKKIVLLCACCFLLFATSIASAAGGMYVSGNVGMAFPTDSAIKDPAFAGVKPKLEYDSGFAFAGAIGTKFDQARLEAEISYQKSDFDKMMGVPISGDATILAGLINGYYDFKTASTITPFITGGLGFAKVEANDMAVPSLGVPPGSDDDTVFAYQVGAGVGYAVNETVNIDLKYRYLGTTDLEFGTTKVEVGTHNVMLGIRVNIN